MLVTGLGGFTGRYVADRLTRSGWEVVGLSKPERSPDYASVDVNLLDKAGTRSAIESLKPNAVIHLAAIAFVAHGEPDQFYSNNIVGSRNLLEALAALETPPKTIMASSANIYGDRTAGAISESAPPHPANDYAVSKLAMEHMAALWQSRLPITITRPFNYTGVGQSVRFLIPKIVRHFRDRAEVIALGNVDVERDFSDVRDVAYAYERLLTNASGGETVNICSGSTYSLSDVIDHCADITGHDIEIRVNPEFIRKNEVKSLSGDRRGLDELTGDFPRRTLRETLEWMLSI